MASPSATATAHAHSERMKPAAQAAARNSRLRALRATPRRPGEASFFFYDTRFGSDSVKVLPGEHFVAGEELVISTTLGSCVAACLWDPRQGVGGMNHIMLPDGDPAGGEAGRIGAFAMELLINALLRRGAQRPRVVAKVFGGGAVLAGMQALNVGERNVRFALDYLATERIEVLGKDVLGEQPRKVAFWPASGKVLVKKLSSAQARDVAASERQAATQTEPARAGGGSIDLF